MRKMKLCEMFNLVQVNYMPAKDNNMLDLLANDVKLFTDIKVNKISTSDHNIMEVTTTYHREIDNKKYDTAR